MTEHERELCEQMMRKSRELEETKESVRKIFRVQSILSKAISMSTARYVPMPSMDPDYNAALEVVKYVHGLVEQDIVFQERMEEMEEMARKIRKPS